MAVSLVKGVGTLQKNTLLEVLTYLDPIRVALCERTCRSWKNAIGDSNQTVWKKLCNNEKIPIVSSEAFAKQLAEFIGAYPSDSGGFTPQILRCIADYALNYKDLAPLRANIRPYPLTWYIYDSPKGSWQFRYCRWGNELAEPAITVTLSYERKGKDRYDDDFPAILADFPGNVPLRLFMDKEGNYKRKGDEIRVIFQGRRIILKCKHDLEFCDQRPVRSLTKALSERVRISLSRRFMTGESLQFSKDLAAKAPEWIDADQRKKS